MRGARRAARRRRRRSGSASGSRVVIVGRLHRWRPSRPSAEKPRDPSRRKGLGGIPYLAGGPARIWHLAGVAAGRLSGFTGPVPPPLLIRVFSCPRSVTGRGTASTPRRGQCVNGRAGCRRTLPHAGPPNRCSALNCGYTSTAAIGAADPGRRRTAESGRLRGPCAAPTVALAQSAEQRNVDPQVRGSRPLGHPNSPHPPSGWSHVSWRTASSARARRVVDGSSWAQWVHDHVVAARAGSACWTRPQRSSIWSSGAAMMQPSRNQSIEPHSGQRYWAGARIVSTPDIVPRCRATRAATMTA